MTTTTPATRPLQSDDSELELEQPQAPRRGFRTDIEGLRAIGVLLVVAFHASIPHLAGGFVGVDVFFVISGFLITGLLLREWDTTGRISLQDFYARRVRRILPAACVVLAVTAIAMPLFLDPLRAYRTALDLGAALLYVGNWRFIHQNNDYLAASNDHSPALHFWSLSVEEQFYLVWPLLVVFSGWFALRWRRRMTPVAGVVLGVVVVGSLLLSLHQTRTNPNLAYMATTTRAWQFGVGGLLALLLRSSSARLEGMGKPARSGFAIVGWVGAISLAAAAVLFDRNTIYPGTAALLPTLGAATIILAGSAGVARGSVGTLLSLRPVRWVGRVSYSWYLWHWPVIVFALAKWPQLGLLSRIGLMVLALGFAALTQRFVEQPAITWRRIRSRGRSSMVAIVVTAVAATAIGLTGGQLRSQLLGQATTTKAPPFSDVFGSAGSSKNSGAVQPSPLRASADLPLPQGCLVGGLDRPPPECVFGPANGKTVVAFGDSHLQQWQTPLIALAKAHDWRLHMIAHGGCPAALFRTGETNGALDPGCAQWRTRELGEIRRLRPAVVILSSQNRRTLSRAASVAAWGRTFNALRSSGAKIIYLDDTVTPPSDVPSCIAANLDDWKKCAFTAHRGHQPNWLSWEHDSVRVAGVSTVNMVRYLCRVNTCPAVLDGVLLYRDDSHITDTAATILEGQLARRLVPLVADAGKKSVTSTKASG